jgi:hypothetical protein
VLLGWGDANNSTERAATRSSIPATNAAGKLRSGFVACSSVGGFQELALLSIPPGVIPGQALVGAEGRILWLVPKSAGQIHGASSSRW